MSTFVGGRAFWSATSPDRRDECCG